MGNQTSSNQKEYYTCRLANPSDCENIPKLLRGAFPTEPQWRDKSWWDDQLSRNSVGALIITHCIIDTTPETDTITNTNTTTTTTTITINNDDGGRSSKWKNISSDKQQSLVSSSSSSSSLQSKKKIQEIVCSIIVFKLATLIKHEIHMKLHSLEDDNSNIVSNPNSNDQVSKNITVTTTITQKKKKSKNENCNICWGFDSMDFKSFSRYAKNQDIQQKKDDNNEEEEQEEEQKKEGEKQKEEAEKNNLPIDHWKRNLEQMPISIPSCLQIINGDQEFVHITDVATDSKYRKKGMARYLFDVFLTAYSKETKFALEVDAVNHNAKDLYSSLGFEHVRSVTNYYGNGTVGEKMVFVSNL